MIEYIIKDTKTIEELEKALAFSKRIFEEHPGFGDENTEKGKWLERMGKNNGLMLYSDWCGEVIGIVFGYMGMHLTKV